MLGWSSLGAVDRESNLTLETAVFQGKLHVIDLQMAAMENTYTVRKIDFNLCFFLLKKG